MMSIQFGPIFEKKLKEIHKKDSKFAKKIQKQLTLFRENPQHPSLRLHKLQGKLQHVWSLSITTSFRLLFINDGSYYFFDMGEHNEIYKT